MVHWLGRDHDSSVTYLFQHFVQSSRICRLIVWHDNPLSFTIRLAGILLRQIFELQIDLGQEIHHFIDHRHIIVKLKAYKAHISVDSNLRVDTLVSFIRLILLILSDWTEYKLRFGQRDFD